MVRLHRARVDIIWLLTGRCGPPLGDYLPMDKTQPLAVFGEQQFCDTLISYAALAVDEFHLRYHKRTGELLRRLESESVLSVYVKMYAARASGLGDVIDKMGASDFPISNIYRVIIPPPTDDLDERIYKELDRLNALHLPRETIAKWVGSAIPTISR